MPGSATASRFDHRSQPADSDFAPSLILSFDIEEHDRIEAAARLNVSAAMKADYASRMESVTRKLLERLSNTGTLATFFIVGEIARSHPKLVAEIANAGHEIAAHSWDHRRVNRFNPRSFADDLRRTKEALEHASNRPVTGFRAPTFSITRDTAWALDVLADLGFVYDSSIYPVRHDRYGIPDAPRCPFQAVGPAGGAMLELPPVTYRMLGQNFPVAGGGYFRLFPLWVTTRAVEQILATTSPPVAMMYLHPWEFDADQPKLPLGFVSKWRTYVNVRKSYAKLDWLLTSRIYRRAIDVVRDLNDLREQLPRCEFGTEPRVVSGRIPRPELVATPPRSEGLLQR